MKHYSHKVLSVAVDVCGGEILNNWVGSNRSLDTTGAAFEPRAVIYA
jgi:hypothetical protein